MSLITVTVSAIANTMRGFSPVGFTAPHTPYWFRQVGHTSSSKARSRRRAMKDGSTSS